MQTESQCAALLPAVEPPVLLQELAPQQRLQLQQLLAQLHQLPVQRVEPCQLLREQAALGLKLQSQEQVQLQPQATATVQLSVASSLASRLSRLQSLPPMHSQTPLAPPQARECRRPPRRLQQPQPSRWTCLSRLAQAAG